MDYSITQNGKPLDKSKYVIDEKAKTFSTEEDDLVLDFGNECGWVFHTGYGCTFNAGSDCTFNTGFDCTFNAGFGCTFNAGFGCTFNAGGGCTFNTSYGCTFKDIKEECVCIRRDLYEVIELPEGKSIRLNWYNESGWQEIDPPKESLVGKEVEVRVDGKIYTAIVKEEK